MTSLDSIPLNEHQELSENDQHLVGLIKPMGSGSSATSFSPLIVSILITITALFLNSDWIAQKLDNIPYYKFSLLGLLFSATLFYILFLT